LGIKSLKTQKMIRPPKLRKPGEDEAWKLKVELINIKKELKDLKKKFKKLKDKVDDNSSRNLIRG